MAKSIQDVALLAHLTIRRWTGRKLDREVTDEVNEQHGAEADAGRYNKRLIEARHFADINRITREARVAFRVMTQPWYDEGARLLPNALNDKFAQRISRELKPEFEAAADAFTAGYPKFVKDAPQRLNSMFKEEDYPHPNSIRSKFSFACGLDMITRLDDIRVRTSNMLDTEQQLQEAMAAAMADPYQRIIEVTEKMVERLTGYKPATEGEKAENIFRDTLVTNIRELADVLPAFNLTNNPKLTSLTDRIVRDLCKFDADRLREDDDLRIKVAMSAEDILKQAKMLMA